jgi:hypothetical protein
MKKLFGILGLCAVLGTASGAESDGVELLYQRALHLETAKADFDGAIPIYTAILSKHAQNAAVAAKALFRQGVCYEKTGKLDLARECARKLSGEFQVIAMADPEMAKWTGRLGDPEEENSRNQDLSRIQLPEQPSREQVKAYIAAISKYSRSKDIVGLNCTEARMLRKVGPEHIDLLIQSKDNQHEEDYIMNYVIVALADESSKKVVLENLEAYPFLAEVVLSRGWAQDAREILLRSLRKAPGYLPLEWVQAVVELNEPDSYPLIRKYFIRARLDGNDRAEAYEILKKLPIEDLPGAVSEAWAAMQKDRNQGYETVQMACIATGYGHLDALELLFKEMARLFNESAAVASGPGEAEEIRIAIARCTGLTGAEEQMLQWWRENRSALRFDRETKKFVPSKDEAKPQRPANGAGPAQ